MKSIAKGLVSLNILAYLITTAAAWFLGKNSAQDLLDVASYVGLGMGALAAFMFVGSSTGTSGSTGIAASAADQPSKIMSALWMDRDAGISAGAMFVLGGSVGSPSHGWWRRSPHNRSPKPVHKALRAPTALDEGAEALGLLRYAPAAAPACAPEQLLREAEPPLSQSCRRGLSHLCRSNPAREGRQRNSNQGCDRTSAIIAPA
jgi:hypothetical protein